jgi:AcrR family transcriptional regulator
MNARSTTIAADARRPGRPRSASRSQDILDAAVRALVEEGYAAMTVEGVAARVGASKATLYRRWPSKADLAADAVTEHACADTPMQDTGDVRADLRVFFVALRDAMSGIDGDLFLAFTAERIRHPELAAAFDRKFVNARRAYLRRIIRAAVERGELPADSDVDLLASVGPAVILHELTNRRALPRDLPDRILRQFFPPSTHA